MTRFKYLRKHNPLPNVGNNMIAVILLMIMIQIEIVIDRDDDDDDHDHDLENCFGGYGDAGINCETRAVSM